MVSRILASAAVLLASVALASAQTGQPGDAGQSPSPGAAPGGGQVQDRGAQQGQEKGKSQPGALGKEGAGQKAREKGKDQQGAGQDKSKDQKGKDGTAQRDRQEGERGKAGKAGDPGTMTAQQRTRIQKTVISRGPKVKNVDFSVNVGTVVPRTIKVVTVPAVFVEVYPQYRGRKYFVYNDQIIIVDDNYNIIAVISI